MGSPAHWENSGGRPPLPTELSDEQRALAVAFIEANPGHRYKAALKAAGIHATKAEAKQLFMADAELRDAYLRPYGLDRNQVLINIGRIAGDPDNRAAMRANEWGGDVFHGWVTTKQVEHKGEISHDHQAAVSVSHDFQAIREKLEGAGVVDRGPAPRALHAAPEPVLPAPADAEPGGGADSAPLAS